MATSKNQSPQILSSRKSVHESMNSNFESFACLWLDQNVNSTDDNLQTQKKLRQVINHLRTFDRSDECEQYIRKITREKVVLIVSGSLGRQIVPRLHDLPQFSACYVFCQDQKGNEQWANKYHKVIDVFVERAKLVAQISKDQIGRSKVEDGASISVITAGSQSLQARNAIFMWFQLFIEVLLRMHHKSNDRVELLDMCKNSYKGNQQEMTIIDEFEKNYKAENAVWWYTRESCFYRMMNKALRVQDFDMLFAFRFFITDIATQIKSEYEKFIRTCDNRSIIRVYRGQIIGNDELELMKKSIGEFVSMNSFLSTSRDRPAALDFARLAHKNDDVQRIIFEIDINPRLQTKAFAHVSQMSYFQNEDELLIMLGALFRIEKVIESKRERVWVARVSLATEDDYHLKETFSYMKSTIGDDTDLDSLGKILIEMGEYEQAEKCFRRMLDEAQLVTGNAALGLGRSCLLRNKADESLDNLEEALRFLYKQKGNYSKALEYWGKSLEISRKILPPTHEGISMTERNILELKDKMCQ
ncbi:unnamed protein product [Rotaria sp. Silwood1]|nr:unnamed protein product [Rotaria sp. Silwood1]CAF3826043.1 unnamed protein product [Rotaria sp. Silwood1]CAF4938958.1 unnamed protein product [Rotaria sp. Silwood1]